MKATMIDSNSAWTSPPRAGWIPYVPRPVSSVAVSRGINANPNSQMHERRARHHHCGWPSAKAPWWPYSYETHSPFLLSETCEISLSGIKSSRRRSIGDATLAGRNREAHQRPVFIAGAFLCPRCHVMAVVRGTPSGVPGPFRPGRPTRVLLPP